MIVQTDKFSDADIARFRERQQTSFNILEKAATRLVGGETEKDVAHQLVKDYYASGAASFFHLPVVLFGDRAGLPGDWSIGKFYPKKKTLQDSESVILDASPIYDGYLVDTSFSFCFGENEAHREMMIHLSHYRKSILSAVNKGDELKQIASSVINRMEENGYQPAHTKHVGEVLGHRAIKIKKFPIQPRIKGFDALAISWFNIKDKLAMSGLGNQSPLWNTLKSSEHRAHDGLWLVEPHAGKDDVGAKWEEIMVIENGQGRWLEDTPPHVRQWQQIEAGKSYAPPM